MSQPQSTTPAAGASFSVDLDRAPQAIRDLEDAAEQLEEIRQSAFALGRIAPPTNDPVSRDAAQVLSSAAVGGPGSFVEAMSQGITQLRGLAESLRQELVSYGRSEELNAKSLGRDEEA